MIFSKPLLFVLVDSETILKEAQTKKEAATKKVADLEYKLKNAKALREKELKDAEDAMKKAKKTADQSNKVTKEKEQVETTVAIFKQATNPLRRIMFILICVFCQFHLLLVTTHWRVL